MTLCLTTISPYDLSEYENEAAFMPMHELDPLKKLAYYFGWKDCLNTQSLFWRDVRDVDKASHALDDVQDEKKMRNSLRSLMMSPQSSSPSSPRVGKSGTMI